MRRGKSGCIIPSLHFPDGPVRPRRWVSRATGSALVIRERMLRFELFLFTTNPAWARRCVDAGVNGIVIDWEFHGKRERQRGADTQINADTVEDLCAIRHAIPASAAKVIV